MLFLTSAQLNDQHFLKALSLGDYHPRIKRDSAIHETEPPDFEITVGHPILTDSEQILSNAIFFTFERNDRR